jgi:hypothetical protein
MLIIDHAISVKIVINKRRDQEYFSLNCMKARFSKVYINVVSLKGLISSIIWLKEHSRQPMVVAARKHICGDTLNIFGHEDHKFQWSRAYSYYSSPLAKKEVIWTSRIAHGRCVPEVLDCK